MTVKICEQREQETERLVGVEQSQDSEEQLLGQEEEEQTEEATAGRRVSSELPVQFLKAVSSVQMKRPDKTT